MIEQALLRTLTLVFSAAVLFTGGCKGTSGGPGEPGSNAAPAGSSGAATPESDAEGEAKSESTPTATATAGESAAPQPPDSTEVFIECTTRSSICTREYSPVCGKLTDGTRRTYSNKCVACSDHAVVGYSPGACPDTPPPT